MMSDSADGEAFHNYPEEKPVTLDRPETAGAPDGNATVYALRQRLAGWHFAQESLTAGEREILHVAEDVLREHDALLVSALALASITQGVVAHGHLGVRARHRLKTALKSLGADDAVALPLVDFSQVGRFMADGERSSLGQAGYCEACGVSMGDGPDACLGLLPGVSHACCGHGVEQAAYVTFGGDPDEDCEGRDNWLTLRADAATAFFALLDRAERPTARADGSLSDAPSEPGALSGVPTETAESE